MSSKAKQVLLWLMIISSAMLFVWFLQGRTATKSQDLSFDDALTRIRNKDIAEVLIKQDSLELTDKNKEKFYTKLDASDASRDILLGTINDINKETPSAIKTTLEPASSGYFWLVMINALPFLLLIGFLAFTLRQMQAGGNKALSFGKSRAKLLNNQQKRVTFKDVAGVEEAKEELQERRPSCLTASPPGSSATRPLF